MADDTGNLQFTVDAKGQRAIMQLVKLAEKQEKIKKSTKEISKEAKTWKDTLEGLSKGGLGSIGLGGIGSIAGGVAVGNIASTGLQTAISKLTESIQLFQQRQEQFARDIINSNNARAGFFSGGVSPSTMFQGAFGAKFDANITGQIINSAVANDPTLNGDVNRLRYSRSVAEEVYGTGRVSANVGAAAAIAASTGADGKGADIREAAALIDIVASGDWSTFNNPDNQQMIRRHAKRRGMNEYDYIIGLSHRMNTNGYGFNRNLGLVTQEDIDAGYATVNDFQSQRDSMLSPLAADVAITQAESSIQNAQQDEAKLRTIQTVLARILKQGAETGNINGVPVQLSSITQTMSNLKEGQYAPENLFTPEFKGFVGDAIQYSDWATYEDERKLRTYVREQVAAELNASRNRTVNSNVRED